MRIIDAENKERNVKNIETKTYEIPDEKGEIKNVICVEFIIIGKHNEWRSFMPLEEFEWKNPGVEIG
jgi:hypothetical protein